MSQQERLYHTSPINRNEKKSISVQTTNTNASTSKVDDIDEESSDGLLSVLVKILKNKQSDQSDTPSMRNDTSKVSDMSDIPRMRKDTSKVSDIPTSKIQKDSSIQTSPNLLHAISQNSHKINSSIQTSPKLIQESDDEDMIPQFRIPIPTSPKPLKNKQDHHPSPPKRNIISHTYTISSPNRHESKMETSYFTHDQSRKTISGIHKRSSDTDESYLFMNDTSMIKPLSLIVQEMEGGCFGMFEEDTSIHTIADDDDLLEVISNLNSG